MALGCFRRDADDRILARSTRFGEQVVALRHRDEPGRALPNLAVGRATAAPSRALVAAPRADIDDEPALGALLGTSVVCAPEVVECRRVWALIRAAFFEQYRAAHSRHPRQ